MFYIGKFFSWLFLPPGIFIMLVIIGIILILNNKKKAGLLFLITDIILLYSLSITPVTNFLLKPLEYAYQFPDFTRINCDAIIILGGGTIGRTPDRSFKNALTRQSFVRTYMGYKLWEKIKKTIIVTGGEPFGAVEPESETMASYLIELGVPEKNIIKETKSRDTIENGKFTKSILRKNNFIKAALVTSAYHMKRSVMIFNRQNISIIPVPTDYCTNGNKISFADFIPQIENIKDSFIAFHEYFGMLSLKIFNANK
jgi:uncharacterized SAM-binding protein YcdF (DUF218 family)